MNIQVLRINIFLALMPNRENKLMVELGADWGKPRESAHVVIL
jgi:hypothetical protein